jgi:hypothetical protein
MPRRQCRRDAPYEGAIWLAVTQGDTDVTRKERIMFAKLEDVGQFESQAAKTRKPLPPPPSGEAAVMKAGAKLFTDRDYVIEEMPEQLRGLPFLRTSSGRIDVEVTKPGTLFARTPAVRPKAASQHEALVEAGFTKVDAPEVQFFPGEINRVSLYPKSGDGMKGCHAKAQRRKGFAAPHAHPMGESVTFDNVRIFAPLRLCVNFHCRFWVCRKDGKASERLSFKKMVLLIPRPGTLLK